MVVTVLSSLLPTVWFSVTVNHLVHFMNEYHFPKKLNQIFHLIRNYNMNKFTNNMISLIKKIKIIIAKHNFNNIYKINHFIVSSF